MDRLDKFLYDNDDLRIEFGFDDDNNFYSAQVTIVGDNVQVDVYNGDNISSVVDAIIKEYIKLSKNDREGRLARDFEEH